MRTVPEWLAEHAIRVPGQRHDDSGSVSLPSGVRLRRPKDLPACARLLRVVATEHQYPARWPEAPRSWLAGPDVRAAWVAEVHGEILGHVAIATGRDTEELLRVSRLFVRRRVRGQGVASSLLDVAVAEIRSQGLLPVLDVASTSTDGIGFIEARGWRLLAVDPWGSKTEHQRIHYYAAPPAPSSAG